MNHVIPHDLEHDRAIRAARQALDSYVAKFAKYDPVVKWTDPSNATVSFRAKGISVSGTLAVRARSVDFDLEVPLLLRPFQGRAVAVIDREVTAWLEKAKTQNL